MNSVATAPANTVQLCTFRVGDLLLGIDVLKVQEVLHNLDVTTVPHAADSVLGLINLRGRIASAIDLGERLVVDRHENDPPERSVHVVVRAAGDVVSLVVDSIDDVLDVESGDYEPPPETMTGAAKELIMGAYKLANELLLVPDVERLVSLRSTMPNEAVGS